MDRVRGEVVEATILPAIALKAARAKARARARRREKGPWNAGNAEAFT